MTNGDNLFVTNVGNTELIPPNTKSAYKSIRKRLTPPQIKRMRKWTVDSQNKEMQIADKHITTSQSQ